MFRMTSAFQNCAKFEDWTYFGKTLYPKENLVNYPSRAKGGPKGANRGKAHLNDVRFNSN